jgi:inosine-uridine nucleoside N-ribohydrolase
MDCFCCPPLSTQHRKTKSNRRNTDVISQNNRRSLSSINRPSHPFSVRSLHRIRLTSTIPYIYDTLALAYLVNPKFATDTRTIWLDIDDLTPSANTTFGANYGKSIPYTSDPYSSIGLLTQSTVVFAVDTDAFLKWYVNLLTLPVPVDFDHGSQNTQ